MANHYPSKVDYQTFFNASATVEHFAALDYALRSGVYLQRVHPEHTDLIVFLEDEDNFLVLAEYYLSLFGLRLKAQYDEERRFYHLIPTEHSASRLPPTIRRELKPDVVIAGLLLCQLVNVDLEEPDTLDGLMSLLRVEYTPYREGLLKHVANLRNSKNFATDRDENKLRKWLSSALDEFTKLGWIYKPGDGTFRVMPALDHLRHLYQEEILAMETHYGATTS